MSSESASAMCPIGQKMAYPLPASGTCPAVLTDKHDGEHADGGGRHAGLEVVDGGADQQADALHADGQVPEYQGHVMGQPRVNEPPMREQFVVRARPQTRCGARSGLQSPV